MPKSYTHSTIDNSSHDLIDDLLFAARYVPKAVLTISLHSLTGAVLGWSSSYICKESWNEYARANHEVIDPNGEYATEDEKYLHFSRSQQFNQITPTITEAIPTYAALLGACTGGFFAATKVLGNFKQELENDRITRHLDIV
ncbi:hypothetical protein J2N86_10670 [Legionella lytica]|uniref:Uncharacterized protein n=1 Tax=Legionella lytica TaxID=96232 RepID=A0ABY4Y693_9GAMM|nr:hypothetical protein [Legionella lytica]USQ13149.1 hypothetical protein J2N86_10670 [Legionella lytica]